MRTTRLTLLVVLLLLGGAVGWSGVAVMQATGTIVGRAPWSAAGGLAFFAALLLAGAWYMYDRVHRKRRTVDGLTAVRLLALAKASALVGALVAGVYAGFAARYLPEYGVPDGRDRVIRGGVTALAAIVVVVGALLLERACKVPKGPEENENAERNRQR
ncbi:DUF3180 domain-containing protein [Actinopolymorpha alba]|uniref:DUF3180 domain-containing protein n=1 Tax=Actinopolymorpha alba TaxID=533267 RepID=UPI0003A25433|nr:DUF3180 domain-containing protein [Actinopolymorpha alba]